MNKIPTRDKRRKGISANILIWVLVESVQRLRKMHLRSYYNMRSHLGPIAGGVNAEQFTMVKNTNYCISKCTMRFPVLRQSVD